MTLKIYRDNTPTISFQVFEQNGSKTNLTGVTEILFLAKTNQNLPNNQATFTKSLSGGQITVPAFVPPDTYPSIFQFNLVESDTKALVDATTLFGDALITDSTGKLSTVGGVTLAIEANISRGP